MPIMDFAAASQRQRAFFQTGATRSVEFRRAQLERLAGALERHEAALLAALQADLGKSPNDVVSHMIGAGLPFGGLGASGMGAYRGRAGFEAFSHQRAVLRRATWLDLPFRYLPQKLSLAGLKRAMRFLLGD